MQTTQLSICGPFLPSLSRLKAAGHRQKNRFASRHARKVDRPHLIHDKIIPIPLFVNGNHWIALCRRIINGRVHFYYSDDLNSPQTDSRMHHLLRASTDSTFYPPDSVWVPCSSTKYTPHSNECGPRTLLSLAVMMLHKEPNLPMLLPYMNPNLANQARCWVTSSILTGSVSLEFSSTFPTCTSSISNPMSLIDWSSTRHSPNF